MMSLSRKKKYIKIFVVFFLVIFALVTAVYLLSKRSISENVQYGMSFNTMYARELGLDWKETYDAILDDLGVRHLRLAAHWPMVEPINNVYNFQELDYQLKKAEEVGADVILAVGRRLPRWPECHIPQWAQKLDAKQRQEEVLEYIEIVVNRYKDNPTIKYWQIENEPYLEVFAKEHCGEFDEEFFLKEVDLFRSLDDTHPFLITDSGNLGTWRGPYKHGDAFGTSVYVYFWNPELGQFKTVLPPWFYRAKANIMKLLYGPKETMIIELSAEPWLLEPIVKVDLETQYSRMNLEKIEDILDYAHDIGFEKQYLWGAEWWYWLKKQGYEEIWNKGKEVFNKKE